MKSSTGRILPDNHPWEKKKRNKERKKNENTLLPNTSSTHGEQISAADIYTYNTWQPARAILAIKQRISLIVFVYV